MSAHNSFQVRWLLGLKVPYFQPINPDVSLEARYAPEVRPQEVFVSRFNTPYDVELLRRFAEAAAILPFRFVSWEEMPCGKHCSKAQLAQFRGSVLCAYDTGPLKLAEFYAMAIPIFIFSGGLWRTTMRWARADAKPAGPVAFSLGPRLSGSAPKEFPMARKGPEKRDGKPSLGRSLASSADAWFISRPALCRLALFALFPGSRRAHNAGSRILGATHWLGTAAAPVALRKCATVVADAAGLITGSVTWILPMMLLLCGISPRTGNQVRSNQHVEVSTEVAGDQPTDGQPLYQALGCLDELLACSGDELGGRWGCLEVERLRCSASRQAFLSFSVWTWGMDRNEINQKRWSNVGICAEKRVVNLNWGWSRLWVDFGNFSHSSPIWATQILSHTQMKQEMEQLCPKSACCSVLGVKTKVGGVCWGVDLWKAAIGWLTSVELQQESDAYDPNNLQFTPIYVIPQ